MGAQPRRTSKVSIIGAGSVGATIAYACLTRGVAQSVTLYDIDADKTRAEVLDLNQGIQFVPIATISGSDDIAVTADSDIVVLTAGAKQRPGQTRLELAGINVELCRKLVPQLVELSPNALLLLVTNPVDVLTYAATKFSGLPHERVVGSGTVLDSSRLRVLLAQHTGVAVQSIHAYIVGEHGDSELPLWSSASIGPIPVSDWTAPGQKPLDEGTCAAIADQVVRAAELIIRGKGATNYAIGLSTARIIEAMLHDEGRVLPVSSLLDGQYGISDICLSLPTVVDRTGVRTVLTPPMPTTRPPRYGARPTASGMSRAPSASSTWRPTARKSPRAVIPLTSLDGTRRSLTGIAAATGVPRRPHTSRNPGPDRPVRDGCQPSYALRRARRARLPL